jgi:hypothetical protein
MSSRIVLTCEAPGTDIPEFFRSTSELIAKRAAALTTIVRVFSAWVLTWLFMIELPVAVVPVFYAKFQHEGYSKPHVSEKKKSPRAASYVSR